MRRFAEFGFFGEIVKTRKQTTFFWGFFFSLGLVTLFNFLILGFFNTWENVAIYKYVQRMDSNHLLSADETDELPTLSNATC